MQHSIFLRYCPSEPKMKWSNIIICMHDDRAEAVQKCFSRKSSVTKRWASLSFKHHLLPNIGALTPADDLHSLLEWNPVVQPIAIFQTDSGYNSNFCCRRWIEGLLSHCWQVRCGRRWIFFSLCITLKTPIMYNWNCSRNWKEKGIAIRIVTFFLKNYE